MSKPLPVTVEPGDIRGYRVRVGPPREGSRGRAWRLWWFSSAADSDEVAYTKANAAKERIQRHPEVLRGVDGDA